MQLPSPTTSLVPSDAANVLPWPRMARLLAAAAVVGVILGGMGCANATGTAPSRSAIATINVADETFRILLDTPDRIEAARAAQRGGRASIPNGRIVAGPQVNSGYSWHLQDVSFAEVTIGVCDGRPSAVEKVGPSFGGGRYCPWSARVVAVQDVP